MKQHKTSLSVKRTARRIEALLATLGVGLGVGGLVDRCHSYVNSGLPLAYSDFFFIIELMLLVVLQ